METDQVSATIGGVKSVRFTLAAVSIAAMEVLRRMIDGTEWENGCDPNDLIVYQVIMDTLNAALPPHERVSMEMLEQRVGFVATTHPS